MELGIALPYMQEEVDLLHKATLLEKSGDKYTFWQYRFGDYYLWNQCCNPSYGEALLLGNCIAENRNFSSFTSHELEYWNNISEKIAHADKDGNIISDILIITGNDLKKLHEIIQNHKNFPLLLALFEDAYEKLKNIFKGYNHKILHDYIGYNIVMELYATRMMSVHDLVENGFLKLPDDPDKSSLGMHMILQ